MTREEAIKRINDIRRIYARYVEIVTENENEALDMAIKALEQEPMRDATPEERESIDKYIKSISKPTGVDFWNSEQEPMREFTEEETKAYSKALDEMYKPTGFNVFNEPCEDAVSRQAVIDAICKICAVEAKPSECKYKKGLFGGCIEYEAIKVIPSAEPKTGHWFNSKVYDNFYICSECGESGYNTFKYCPNCGCHMIELKESEK